MRGACGGKPARFASSLTAGHASVASPSRDRVIRPRLSLQQASRCLLSILAGSRLRWLLEVLAMPSPETPLQIVERTSIRELQLSRLLIFYISGGILFMLLPGTFLTRTDPSSRTCPGTRLDWQFYSRHRLLLHSEVARGNEALRNVVSMVFWCAQPRASMAAFRFSCGVPMSGC